MKNLYRALIIAALLCAGTVAGTQPLRAGQSGSETTAPHSWTTEQIVTSSVREAWALGGKTEEGFFDIVKALAELSAQKRAVTLPENKEAGGKAGDWIKKQAKKDPDQLLYVIVDQAVQHSARMAAAH